MKYYSLYTPWVEKKTFVEELFLRVFYPKKYREYIKMLEKQQIEREHFIKQLNESVSKMYKDHIREIVNE